MKRDEMLKKRIGILYGGMSSERDVSLETGQAIHDALADLGYQCILIDQGRDLADMLHKESIDIAFLALHGKYGEDGCVQGLLEILGIPYTGTKVFGSALALDKHMAKIAFADAGLPVAKHMMIRKTDAGSMDAAALPFPLPAVVKPNASGSSVGVSIVHDPDQLTKAAEEAFTDGADAMIEQFASGMEVSVPVLNGTALGCIQIKPAKTFYDYDAKYESDDTEYIYPAPLSEELTMRCLDYGTRANTVVRGEGATRTDLIVSDQGEIVVLEINTMPGMTSHSLVPKVAKAKGMSFGELCERILLGASLGIG